MKYYPFYLVAMYCIAWTGSTKLNFTPQQETRNTFKSREPRSADLAAIKTRLIGAVGGRDHEFPFILTGYMCQGSLIAKNWMLSAGHCFILLNPINYNVRAGVLNESWVGPGEQNATITQYIFHPEFNGDTFNNDLALLKFEPPFEETDTVKIIPLAPKGYQGEDCAWVVSFQEHSNTGKTGVIHKVDVPIRSNELCTEDLGKNNNSPIQYNGSTMLCAGYDEGGKDTCRGDSGTPMIVYMDGKPVQVGITSWGIKCALPHRPGVYTKVSNYVDWIEETIRNN